MEQRPPAMVAGCETDMAHDARCQVEATEIAWLNKRKVSILQHYVKSCYC